MDQEVVAQNNVHGIRYEDALVSVVESKRDYLIYIAEKYGAGKDAEDVVQEAAAYCFSTLDRYSGEKGKLFSWLTLVVAHRAVDLVRRGRNEYGEKIITYDNFVSGSNADEEELETVVDYGIDHRPQLDLKIDVQRAFKALPDKDALLARAVYLEGMTNKEAALALGIPVRTVERRMPVIKQKLQYLLRDWR